MSGFTDSRERADALLLDRATEGLDGLAEQELAALLERDPKLDHEGYDAAAAALALAMIEDVEPMPASLRQRLVDDAPSFDTEAPSVPTRARSRAWVGWVLAAAAVLLLIVLELRHPAVIAPRGDSVVVVTPPAPSTAPAPVTPPEPSAAEARQLLLRDDPEALVLAWSSGGDASGTGVAGDVVWSERRQAGFMSLRGLQPNDPRDEVYQLWIFDAERDERYPVDGGVFSVEPGRREVVVPIDARLPVSRATLFAVTVEPPGGVVVSDRSRIAALAKRDG